MIPMASFDRQDQAEAEAALTAARAARAVAVRGVLMASRANLGRRREQLVRATTAMLEAELVLARVKAGMS